MMFAKLCALLAILYLVKLFLYPIYKPVNRKQRKRTRSYINEKKSSEFKQKLLKLRYEYATKYVGKFLSSAERIRIKKLIDRLDLNVKPEEVRMDQILYSTGAVLVTLFLMSANMLLGCLAALLIMLGWLYPVQDMEQKIDKKNKNISLDFPSFYSMVYYQYAKSVNIYLADVIKDYIPNANSDMAEELGVMLDNIEYGEEHALKQLKKRVPMHYVIKFCDIMETRLKGYDNTSQMTYLKNEVDEFRIRALEDELLRRERSNAKVQIVLIVILGIYIAIYYLFTILDSLAMFQ